MKSKYKLAILLSFILYLNMSSQQYVKENVYHEFGFAVSGINILGDWIEHYNFKNIAQLTGIGISGINRINLKNERISLKNTISFYTAKNNYSMDYNRYGAEYEIEVKKKSAVYSDSYLMTLGSQIEYNFFNSNIYRDINHEVKVNPYVGLGLGLLGYYSNLDSYISKKEIPDILKENDNFNSKLGVTIFFNFSIGVKFSITKRSTIYTQISYSYTFSDKIDWIENSLNKDYLQEFQVGYTYIL